MFFGMENLSSKFSKNQFEYILKNNNENVLLCILKVKCQKCLDRPCSIQHSRGKLKNKPRKAFRIIFSDFINLMDNFYLSQTSKTF